MPPAITGPGPLYEMAGLAPPPEPPRELPGDDNWSNIGRRGYVQARPETPEPVSGTSPHLEAERPPAARPAAEDEDDEPEGGHGVLIKKGASGGGAPTSSKRWLRRPG